MSIQSSTLPVTGRACNGDRCSDCDPNQNGRECPFLDYEAARASRRLAYGIGLPARLPACKPRRLSDGTACTMEHGHLHQELDV